MKDAQEMFDAAQASGVQLYVAQVLQFTREVEQLHRIVDERALTDSRWTPALSGCPSGRHGAREIGCSTGTRAAFAVRSARMI